MVFADLVTEIVLAIQLDAPPGELSEQLTRMSDGRAEIHQATGMASVQLEVSPADALSRLRAHAWSHQRSLTEVARDVVAGRLRFRQDSSADDHG